HDGRTVVLDGFGHDLVGERVEVLLAPRSLAATETFHRVVPCLRLALLHLRAPLFELAYPVVVVVALPARAGRSDSERIDAEVDTGDRTVLGICRTSFVVAVVPPCRNVCVELVGRVVVANRTLSKLVLLAQDVPFVGCRGVRRQNERTDDTPFDGRKRQFAPSERRTPPVVVHRFGCEQDR